MEHGGFKLKKSGHGVVELINHDDNPDLVILAIPDLHIPFHHPDAFRFLKDIRDEFNPDLVVCLGDEVELASLSFHDKNPDAPSAKDEYLASLGHLQDLYKLFPDVLVCNSNHTSRPYRVAFSAGMSSHMMKSYNELLNAPKGWSWHDRIIIQNVCYIHGDPKSGANATKAWMNENRMSTIHGHIHGWGGVQYSSSPFKQIVGMNAGCLIDLEAIAFKYGSKYANKGTLGCGIIRGGREAHFIPMR